MFQESWLRSKWFGMAFAAAWIGALSLYWIHIKMSARFQLLLGLGVGLKFPVSLLYISVVYAAAISTIVSVGLAIYLSITGNLKRRRLLRGLSVILFVVILANVAGIFLRELSLPPVIEYMTSWLPLFLALCLSMWWARRESVPVTVVRGDPTWRHIA